MHRTFLVSDRFGGKTADESCFVCVGECLGGMKFLKLRNTEKTRLPRSFVWEDHECQRHHQLSMPGH